jgi:choline transport protein
MIQALAVYNNPTYVPQRWHATLMVILLGGMTTIGVTILKKLLPLWEILGGTLHV